MKSSAINPHPINRIQSVLDYIHTNLDSTLSVDEISKASCWSRWQLQRVFQQHTGVSVAHYIRELKLSLAAERLIHTSDRSLDIAIEMGFTSEHAFSRAFRNMFSKSPREYRKTQQLSGLRQPLTLRKTPEEEKKHQRFIEVRIETKPLLNLLVIMNLFTDCFPLRPISNPKYRHFGHVFIHLKTLIIRKVLTLA